MIVSASDSIEMSALRVKVSPPTDSSAVLSLANVAPSMGVRGYAASMPFGRE